MNNTSLTHRINRIQGQLEAVKKQLNSETPDCVQIFRLVKASNNAMKKFAEEYAKTNLKHCMGEKISKTELSENLTQVIETAFSL